MCVFLGIGEQVVSIFGALGGYTKICHGSNKTQNLSHTTVMEYRRKW